MTHSKTYSKTYFKTRANHFIPLHSLAATLPLLVALTLPAAAQATTGVTGITPSATTGVTTGATPSTRVQPMQSAPTGIQSIPQPKLTPLPQATLTPELVHLIELETRFAADVAKGGGKAFASWFADDAVTLNNGQPAVLGSRDIASHAQWDPKEYQLTWQPEGAQLSPSGDMGFTWGHYDATTIHPTPGQPAQSSGRYITIWKRLPGGEWKVALDASADDEGQTGATGQQPLSLPTPTPAPSPVQ